MSGYRRRRRFGPVPRTHFLCLVSLVIQNSSLEGGFSDASLFPSWHQSKSKSAWASINTALHIRLANNLCCRNITVCIKITPLIARCRHHQLTEMCTWRDTNDQVVVYIYIAKRIIVEVTEYQDISCRSPQLPFSLFDGVTEKKGSWIRCSCFFLWAAVCCRLFKVAVLVAAACQSTAESSA